MIRREWVRKQVGLGEDEEGEYGKLSRVQYDKGWREIGYDIGVPEPSQASLAGYLLGNREKTPLELFREVFTESLMEKFTEMIGFHRIRPRDVEVFIGMRCILQGKGKPPVPSNPAQVLLGEYTRLKQELDEEFNLPRKYGRTAIGSHKLFSRYLVRALLTPTLASNQLKAALSSLFPPTLHVLVDEKLHRHFREYSICRYAPYGNAQRSPWLTQLCTVFPGTLLPLCLGFYGAPFNETAAQVTLWKWVRSQLGTKVILWLGSQYTSRAQMGVCSALGLRWAAPYRAQCFPSMQLLLSQLGSHPGEYRAMINPQYHTTLVSYTEGMIGSEKRVEMGNIWQPDVSNEVIHGPSLSLAGYQDVSQACDMWNEMVLQHPWPYDRRSWDRHMDSYLFTSILINCFHIWKSLGSFSLRSAVAFDDFCIQLGRDLILTASRQ